MINLKKISIITILIILITGLAFIIEEKSNVKTVETSAQSLSTKKIGWGIKRNDNHKQPDLGKTNKEIIEKNNGIAMGNSDDKYIYLTFDEGYEAGYTKQILSTLKENITPKWMYHEEDWFMNMGFGDGYILVDGAKQSECFKY